MVLEQHGDVAGMGVVHIAEAPEQEVGGPRRLVAELAEGPAAVVLAEELFAGGFGMVGARLDLRTQSQVGLECHWCAGLAGHGSAPRKLWRTPPGITRRQTIHAKSPGSQPPERSGMPEVRSTPAPGDRGHAAGEPSDRRLEHGRLVLAEADLFL